MPSAKGPTLARQAFLLGRRSRRTKKECKGAWRTYSRDQNEVTWTAYLESRRAFRIFSEILGIFLGIKGAFDNLSADASIQGMQVKHLPPHIVRWYSYYLHF